MAVIDQRRLHPRLTETDLDSTPFVPELSPVVNPHGDSLMTRPWLDWARRLTLLVGVNTGGGSGGTGDVVGPNGASADAIAIYSGTTGKLIKDSLKTIGQVISDAVNQAIAAILPGGKLPVSNLPLHHLLHQAGGVDAIDVKLLTGYPANTAVFLNGAGAFSTPVAGVPGPHHLTHEPGGSDPMAVDAAAAVGSLRTLGTGANQAAPGNDVRFSTLAAHHATHEPGGTDALINAAWTNLANTFTQQQTLTKSGSPALHMTAATPVAQWTETAAPVDAKKWQLFALGQAWYVSALNDAETTNLSYPLKLSRNGDVLAGNNLFVTGAGGNVACKNQVNVFTQSQTVSMTTPGLALNDTSAPVDARLFDVFVTGQQLRLRALNDNGTLQNNTLILDRSGNAFVAANLYEKSRVTPLGHWTDIPFNAGNFSAVGATWTVTAHSVFAYTIVGKTVTLSLSIGGTSSITGTPPVRLRVTLPAEIANVARPTQGGSFHYFANAAGTGFWNFAGSQIDLLRDASGTAWPVSSPSIYLTIQYSIT